MTSQALVRWGEGWKYHGTSGDGTIAANHSDYTDEDSVDRLVDAELAEATDDESTVSVRMTVVPRNGDDRPFVDFDIGDAVKAPNIDGTSTAYRVVAITATPDRDGNIVYEIECNALSEESALRQRRFLDLASPGALSGRGDNVAAADLGLGVDFGRLPVSELASLGNNEELVAVLDWDDPEDQGHTGWIPIDEPILIYRHPWSLQTAGSTDTEITVRYRHPDQSTIDEFPYIIAAGVRQPDESDADNASFYTNLPAAKGSAIQAGCTDAGDGAAGLTFRTKYTTQ